MVLHLVIIPFSPRREIQTLLCVPILATAPSLGGVRAVLLGLQ